MKVDKWDKKWHVRNIGSRGPFFKMLPVLHKTNKQCSSVLESVKYTGSGISLVVQLHSFLVVYILIH